MPCSKGVINKTCPSRDSTRIAKHTFDAAKIGIISESCKDFAFYKMLQKEVKSEEEECCLVKFSLPLHPNIVSKGYETSCIEIYNIVVLGS